MHAASTAPSRLTPEDELHWLALRLVPGLGTRRVVQLMDRFASPQVLFRTPVSDLEAAGVPPGPARLDRPRRCTLPITALRVTAPSSLAIWLADWPSAHIFLSVSTRSSVQDMGKLQGIGRVASF